MTSRGPNAKGWCYTDNIPRCWVVLPKGVTYMIWQQEKVGHHHTQGYVELSTRQRMSWLRKHVSDTARWVARNGTPEQAIDYCKKEDSRTERWLELGKKSEGQGARSDIKAFVEVIKKGKRERELWDTHTYPMAKWPRLYARVSTLWEPEKNKKKLHVTIGIGAHGTGKTYFARYLDWPEAQTEMFVVPLARTGMWFSGYDHHKHVVMDDFDGRLSKLGLKELLRLLHDHTERVETKNGHAWWHPETIFITTNIPMGQWYDWGERSYKGVKTRVHRILDFGDEAFVICKDPKDVTDTYDWVGYHTVPKPVAGYEMQF